MRSERILHTIITLALIILITLCACVLIFLVIILSQFPQRSKLSALTQTPFAHSELVVEFGSLRFATASSTIVATRTQNQELFDLLKSSLGRKTKRALFDSNKLTSWISQVALEVDKQASPPAVLSQAKAPGFTIFPGQIGRELDVSNTVAAIQKINPIATNSAFLVVGDTGVVLSPDALIESERRARRFSTIKMTLNIDNKHLTIGKQELLPLLSLPSGFNSAAIDALLASFSDQVEHPPIEPELKIENTTVTHFVAPRDGRSINKPVSHQLILEALLAVDSEKPTTPLTLPIITTPPTQTLGELNALGIRERIGLGTSEYSHSIPNRIHNVALTTSKMHAVLVLPGQEFSFNKQLGDVSKETGFKQAYVIKEGQTVLGDGGGVCQVSSTLFRSLLNAGLPITARRGHSYRVGYYEQNSKPGFDATVFAPAPDLKFVNDTGSAILINAVADSKNTSMYIELWGTADGRKAEIKDYKLFDQTPPPPTRYQDDPTLPPGKLVQVEYAASGAKTSFSYVVTYSSGEVKTKTFNTSYIPWGAVYLRGI